MDEQLNQYKDLLDAKLLAMFGGEGSGHDLNHLMRVYNLALHIQLTEGGDRLVIGIAALLHDVHRLMKREDGKLTLPIESLPTIKEMLDEVNFPSDAKEQVLKAIELHEDYYFAVQHTEAVDRESKILQDADRLEAIGAIGIARCFAFAGAHGVPIYNPNLPLDSKPTDSSQADPSGIHHFYRKLLKLGEGMHTETAKKIAKERHHYMEEFVERFLKEWKGEK